MLKLFLGAGLFSMLVMLGGTSSSASDFGGLQSWSELPKLSVLCADEKKDAKDPDLVPKERLFDGSGQLFSDYPGGNPKAISRALLDALDKPVKTFENHPKREDYSRFVFRVKSAMSISVTVEQFETLPDLVLEEKEAKRPKANHTAGKRTWAVVNFDYVLRREAITIRRVIQSRDCIRIEYDQPKLQLPKGGVGSDVLGWHYEPFFIIDCGVLQEGKYTIELYLNKNEKPEYKHEFILKKADKE
jgi:hypothetical protein